jgi:lactate dehydrogenase-like 2-hydroxyacid dehydrogenase
MSERRRTVVVTRKLPSAVEERLARDYQARLNGDDHQLAADELVALAEGADGLLVTPTDRVDAGLIARLPESVRVIATFSVGFEHIDLAAASQRGLAVTNTPDVLTEATAEVAILLMLGAARRAWEAESLLRAGGWRGWSAGFMLGRQLTGKRLGIVGMGRIGLATARIARALGLAIHYHQRRPLAAEQEDGAVFHPRLDDLLPLCDVLSLHCPATPETLRLLDARRLALLPPGAVVVNAARGTLVDDDSLIAALRSGRVAAAGLDVFAGEPQLDPRYRELPNAMLLPHIGSATMETRDAMGFRALDNLDAWFAGRQPPDRVG